MNLIYLILYILLIHLSFVDEQEINLCSSLKHENNDKVKYIFNLDRWRGLMLKDRIYFWEMVHYGVIFHLNYTQYLMLFVEL